ncbi:hypothetical protein EV421DRAFT_880022 [Armillaria borealis]|uniref:Uncharacterized protein n=1 Tax=Armillaria borealis TaxID=47425 RepID=A0AA39M5M1_9AGAR|nr:hypothetical protein EV421DRAFT_880022 [Armillaria borealis]
MHASRPHIYHHTSKRSSPWSRHSPTCTPPYQRRRPPLGRIHSSRSARQRVPLALLDSTRVPNRREGHSQAGACQAYLVFAGRASSRGERSSLAPRPSSTITLTSPPTFWHRTWPDAIQWVVENLPGSGIYILGSDKYNMFTILALYSPLYQSRGRPLWTVHMPADMKDAVGRCRR